jgi:hypothetical protein
MAEDKKGFVLYADLIYTVEKLPTDDQAKLFMAILRYVNDEKFEVDSFIVDVVFEPIKQQLKRDLIKWEGIRQRRSAAGRSGGLKSGETRKKEAIEANEANVQSESIEANASFALQKKTCEANEAVNVNVTGNVSVTGNVNVNDIISKEIKEKLKNENFSNELLNSDLWVESIYMQNKMVPNEKSKVQLNKWIEAFNVKLLAECDSKISKNDYGAHFSRWLMAEILKRNKSNLLNSNDPYFQKLSKPKFLS